MGGKPQWAEAEVRRGRRGWRVLIPAGDSFWEYAYPTRRKAGYFAAIFRLGPTWCPPPDRVTAARAPRRAKAA